MLKVFSLIRPNGAGEPAALPRIRNLDEWSTLSARHGYSNVSRTEAVKVIIDRHKNNKVHFVNSRRWEMHLDYVVRFINPRVDEDRFLIEEYTRENRRFILCTVMHYLDGDHWTLELAAGDTMNADMIMWTFQQIAERMEVSQQLRFRPLSVNQIKHVAQLGDRLPALSRDAINASVEYQPIVLGVAYGYLKLVRDTLDVSAVRPYDIVVTEDVPDEIPPIAALVTSQLQAPLAHVAVLNRNRNTPDMALRNAADRDEFQKLEGELVKLTVGGQDYTLERAGRAEAEAAWEAMRPKQASELARDMATTGLFDIGTLTGDAISCVGAKAAQLGELSRLDGITIPKSFALPFSTYMDHLESAHLVREIDTMLADPAFLDNPTARAGRLAALRKAIMAAPVDPALLEVIKQKLASLSANRHFIFRSSTNAEDLDGFNGAGLYASLVVPSNPTQDQIADVLRAIWASVWLQRAFEERDWYRIDHKTVAMGILVQPFFDDAIASGVAITGNPYKENVPGVFINAQISGKTVTGAVGNELPEQYLVTIWYGDYEIELLSTSSLTNGSPIFTEVEVTMLTAQLMHIHQSLLPKNAAKSNAMDVEFVLTRDRRFVIVQARPYNIVYSLDRTGIKRRKSTWECLIMGVRRFAHRFVLASVRDEQSHKDVVTRETV